MVWEFDSPAAAEDAIPTLQHRAGQELDEVCDAATVSWDPGGEKPKTRQLRDLTGAGALGGMSWGTPFGLILVVPLLGAALGAATGTVGGALTDVGIDDDVIQDVRQQVTPGSSALVVMASDAGQDEAHDASAEQHPPLLRTNLSTDQVDALRTVFAA
ncbi:conserved protein of unknown function [Modestobacter italicus]|uniref:DUF1269 domain-containing protein n=1 Tax=Modestobacter italicus (strain DSM 44449 / CECT 9708 / BC 501) TaxID=2732864 RepID=I4EUA8_MODI5|nr:DUF1269 domain-containing protein [Modestobacter marinus]CCH86971.1 conserved protein of unknown function [Modestobacter marinus]